MSRVPYLDLSQCQHGYLYFVLASNFHFGVFDQEKNGFVGVREKFGSEYVFCEIHYDANTLFGTACPYLLLEKCDLEDLSTNNTNEGGLNNNIRVFSPFRRLLTREANKEFAAPRKSVVNEPLHNYLLDAEERYQSIPDNFVDFRIFFEFVTGF